MKRSVYTILAIVALVLVSVTDAMAIKASAKIVKYRQPDGSFVSLKVVGDEFFGYITTLQGHIVSVAPNGYIHYADYNSGVLRVSNIRVQPGKSAPAGTKGATGNPQNVSGNPQNVSGNPQIVSSVPHSVAHSLRSQAMQRINPAGFGAASTASIASTACAAAAGTPASASAVATKSQEAPIGGSLVLLVEFSDLPFTVENPEGYFNNMLNGANFTRNGATGSVAEYFNANFRGTRDFRFQLSAVITLSKEAAYYGEHTPYMNDANVTGMVVEACKIASENGVDFSNYDTDSDGVVDNVAIIFSGLNEAESGNPLAIWPHKGDISDRNIFCNGVKIASYTCTSEYSGDAQENTPATIGSFCHEYAHRLGLVDMYDVNDQEEGLSPGLYGTLSLMDRGNYLNGGKTPPYFNSIELEMLDIVPVADLCPDRNYRLLPVHMADSLYRAVSSNPGEYFFFECRNTSGWDRYIGGEGLVVYHLDKSDNMYGGLSAAARWRLNIVNSYAVHQCARLLSEHVFYPGTENVTSLTSTGDPSFTDWQHSGLGISIADIKYDGGAALFSVKEDIGYNEAIPGVEDFTVETYQECACIRWTGTNDTEAVSGSEAVSRSGALWVLMLESGDELIYKGTVPASCTRFLFRGLEPQTTCRGKIYMVDKNCMGDVYTFEFTTDPISSPYPFVKLYGGYRVGDIVDIFVQNLVEEHTGIEVRMNGEKIQGDSYEFAREGVYELEVSIRYPQGSSDIITKRIEVKNQ